MEGKPEDVRDAQKRGDSNALTAMGTKGAIHAGLMNADRKNKKEKDLDAFLAKQERIYQVNDEGDVLPPDPTLIENLKH